ncbi:ABC transporter substrate-binding protein [Chengkuizengella axinellae]|uniref:ABC transporter substrate-binding protein n=1 Tax=Chengkuizengella axinellae TaxID=3064388 RepID=A0ABT9J2X9_9BACL|nr:ABC transporter substrate-binding protein [Chengkuizengella sp. 2205SS18-9]MDP5275976.1 ABC transporter substrate-binding protein [Chengkuizengella sp. 2205SS18-9]
MKDLDYFQMRSLFYTRENNNTVEFKLKELQSLWYCNMKNTKLKVKKFEAEGKYIYKPGRGRGNSSQLFFHMPFQEEIQLVINNYIKHDRLEDAFQLLQLPIPKSWVLDLTKEIQKKFGYQSNPSKDVLRQMMLKRIVTLDPLQITINFEEYLISHLGSTLVTFDQKTDTVQPHLAHHWDTSNHHKTWTFHLRKGVHFHHQRILNSEDVKFTFERYNESSSAKQWLVDNISQIECISPYIVRFHLSKPNPLFLRYVSTTALSILPKDEPFDEYKWIGTGPFQLKKRTKNMIVLEAFDLYFLERPFIDEIEFYLVSNEAKDVMNIQIRGVDAVEESSINKVDTINGVRFLAINFNKPSIVHNLSFRTALYHLLYMKKMWKDCGYDHLTESTSYFPWKSKQPQPKNRKLIKALLQASGYQGELLAVYTKNIDTEIQKAEWLVAEADEVGIKLEYKVFDMDDFYSPLLDQDADLLFASEVSSYDHHLSFIEALSNKTNLFQRFLSKEHISDMEHLLSKMKFEADKNMREYWMDQIEQYFRQDHLILYLYHPRIQRTFNHTIQDSEFEALGYDDFRKAWINMNQ